MKENYRRELRHFEDVTYAVNKDSTCYLRYYISHDQSPVKIKKYVSTIWMSYAKTEHISMINELIHLNKREVVSFQIIKEPGYGEEKLDLVFLLKPLPY